MKLKIQILLILIHISGYIFSQGMNFEWEKTIGTSGNNVGKSIIYDNNGYLYVAGEFHEDFILDNTTISGKGNNNIFIVKLDLNGNLIWSKSLGGNFAILGQICFDVNMDIVCTGTFSGALILKDTIISSNGGTDIFIMKIKNTGEILSVFSDGGIGNESSHSLCIDKNNDLFVCGNLNGTSTFGNQSVTSSGYWQDTPWGTSVYLYEDTGFFVKYNSQNKCIFAKLICKNRSALFSIVSDTDNNIYTSGFFASYSNITDTIASEIGNFLVFKYDQDGKFINLIQEGSDNNFILVKALAIDKENNLLVTGSIGCSGCIFGDSLLPSGNKDAFLAKYDHRGNLKWINLLGQDHDEDGNANSGNSIVIDNDNNVLITGEFDYIDFNGVITKGNNSSIDFLVMKFDQNGHLINMGKYGNTTWDGGEGLTIDNANNIYFTGYTYAGATSTEYPSYIFIGKIDSVYPLGIRDKIITDKIKVYPIPSKGEFFIDLPSDFFQEAKIEILSLDGKMMYNTSTFEKHNQIHFPYNKPGIYILKLLLGDKVYFKKLLIQ